jgi:hypothetical protein
MIRESYLFRFGINLVKSKARSELELIVFFICLIIKFRTCQNKKYLLREKRNPLLRVPNLFFLNY